ncbi:MAG: hypothetical protein M3Z26_02785 [Bacteroidota bacterium]|nr:hypothetical protein [Bacteroidota bacterium]
MLMFDVPLYNHSQAYSFEQAGGNSIPNAGTVAKFINKYSLLLLLKIEDGLED